MFPVLWNLDSMDWSSGSVSHIVERIVSKAGENDIILMHDYYDTSVTAVLKAIDEKVLDRIRYDDYITFLDVIGDRIVYFRTNSDCEEWWADKADLKELLEKGIPIGPFYGSRVDTLDN